MTQPTDRPGINQLRNLADRAERGALTADEAARLRNGINTLATRAEKAEATLNAVRATCNRLHSLARSAHGQPLTDVDRTIDHTINLVRAVLDQHGQTPA